MAGVLGRKLCRYLAPIKSAPQAMCSFTFKTGIRFASVKAAILHQLTEPMQVAEVTRPKKLKKDEVRVKVFCCGLNTSDILIASGEYDDVAPDLPFVPGFEVAGKITEVGSAAAKEGFAVGNRVVLLNKLTFGGLAEECVANVSDVWNLPNSISYSQAAALADAYSTSLLGLSRRAHVKENDTILISAGVGGLGLAAVDIAANVFKAKVIAVCETENMAHILRQRGAWAALTFHPKNIVKKVNDATKGKGVQIVLDAVGGPFFDMALQSVAHEGTVIVAGYAIRRIGNVDPMALLPKACNLLGISLRNYKKYDLAAYRQAVQDSVDMCEQELISPLISKTFELDSVNDAFEYYKVGESVGKVIVNVASDESL